MKKNAKNRRGFTLAELTIVLAVIAIVSTMVVSYVTIITQRNRAATERLNAMQDIQVIESMTEAWIEAHPGVSWDSVVSADNDQNGLIFIDKHLCFSADSGVYSLRYEGEEKARTYTASTVKKIELEIPQKNDTDILYFVTVTYELSDKNGLQTYTFCVNPYVGEGVN